MTIRFVGLEVAAPPCHADRKRSLVHAILAISTSLMRILTRYILREVTAHALIGVAIFTFVLFTRDLGRILELVVRASAPLPSVAEVFFLTVPLALTYTLPMSVLVGILIGLSRLAADSEITAMRASGMGVWHFLRILSIFVIAAWLLALANGLYIAPKSQAALGRLEDRLKGSQVSFEIQPRVFYEGFPKIVLYVQDVKSAQGAAVWKGVFMADLTDATNSQNHAGPGGHRGQRRAGAIAPASDRRLGARNRPEERRPLPDFNISADRHPYRPAFDREQARRVAARDAYGNRRAAGESAPQRSRVCPLVSDRISPPLRAADRMPRAGAGRNSSGPVVEEKRQVRWIRADDPAGVRLLRHLAGWSLAGPSGNGRALVRSMARRHRCSRAGRFLAVAGRKASL